MRSRVLGLSFRVLGLGFRLVLGECEVKVCELEERLQKGILPNLSGIGVLQVDDGVHTGFVWTP